MSKIYQLRTCHKSTTKSSSDITSLPSSILGNVLSSTQRRKDIYIEREKEISYSMSDGASLGTLKSPGPMSRDSSV